jgi:NADH-quinone oxidoreductase subunit G
MNISFFVLLGLFFSSLSQIELPLYKSQKNNDIISFNNATIESIEHSHFLTDLKLGSPMQSIPLEISMTSDEILILNNKNNIYKKKILSEKTSRTYQVVKSTKENKIPAIDKFVVYKNGFDLQFKSVEKLKIEDEDEASSGILGFSLGDIDDKHKNKFVNQLSQKSLISNSIFYFDFERKHSKNEVTSLEEYLNIRGKLMIGEYPSSISPDEQAFSKKYMLKTAPIVQKLQVNANADPTLYDDSSYSILLNFNKCVGCTRCARACATISGQNILECEHGQKSHTATGQLLVDTKCISCGQCSLACPMAAITEHYNKDNVTEVLKNKKGRIAVCQIAPAVRINMAEDLGVEVGTISTGKIVTALKMLGFDYIFDINFSADMTIVEEATEFVKRYKDPDSVFPMFTSCCPAWINYVEKSRPDLIPNLSTCRSPLSMLSSVIKNIFAKKIGVSKENIYNVGIMPCTAKKDEIKRPQLNNETDAIITSRELAKMIQEAGIDFANLKETELDSIYSNFTGGGAIFCATGGVMEAALRSAYKFLTGKNMVPLKLNAVRGYESKIKTASIDINGDRINVAVAHGIINAMELIDKIEKKEAGFENIHFVEVMACPGGCVIGGGSPKAKTNTVIEKRLNATYSIDKSSVKRVSQDNEQLNSLYKESFDGTYGGEYAQELLHTYYTNRKVDKTWGLNFKLINFNHTGVSSFYSQSLIKIENNFIKAPYNFLPVLNREFLYLKEIKEQCSLYHSFKYDFILCKKDFDVNKFPKLEFYSDELDHSFVLEGKDLFIYDTKNSNYIFLIVFDIHTQKQTGWELGLPFLIKYKMFFDFDNESLGIIEKINDVKKSGFNIAYISFALGIILIFLILFMIPRNKQRKKRLNELEEEGEYNYL